ncbi:hypothetical protein YK48G_24930 [Lentilactobacillus fungorum]|uniref:Uncharacterized protein n=1 Tax=Lentilactobacillus fungorum TaxID=2201250 RepID=A0ABQ3W3P8_9LACO|nr:hypothetical protein [Lentilactobacillus fungorum]GHP15068.1 hypothetical protein YK48G_24930 [Lentilactobacillus fungorum]
MSLTKNDQVILLSAKEDLFDQRFQQVLNKTDHLLERSPNDPEVNFVKAQALFKLNHFQEAQQLLIDFKDEMMVTKGLVAPMIEMSIKNGAFMFARELAAGSQNGFVSIEAGEVAYRQKKNRLLQQNTSRFAHASALSAYGQVQAVEAARWLPLKEYLLAASGILRDPFAWQVTKTQILLELVTVKADVTITLNWLDRQDYQIKIAELKPIDQVKPLLSVLQMVEEAYSATDPIKLQLVEKELITQSHYIYPFFHKVITDPQYWKHLIIGQLFGDDVAANSDSQRSMQDWVAVIHQAESEINLQ